MLNPAKRLTFQLTGTLLLLLPALINGYPMIYSDTSTYLASGFEMQPPMDRPMTYGLFIRLFSLNGLSLWPVIFMQSFILSWLIFHLTCLIFKGKEIYRDYIFLAVLAVSSFSGAGWASCYLIPDIFTPIMLLSAILLLLSGENKGKRTAYYLVYGFSTAMHSSHIPIGIALLSILLLARYLFGENIRALIKVRPLVILIGITLGSILAMGSSLSKSKHVFLMGAFIEQGIIKPYLDENCDSFHYNLCVYKDSLPEYAWQFIWQESSPLYKLGGWKETKEEFNAIIRGTFFSPKFMLLHVEASFKATIKQLGKFVSLHPDGVAPNASQLHSRVESYVPHDLYRFENSRQNLGNLGNLRWFNRVQLFLVVLSTIFILLFFSISRAARANQVLLLTGMILLLGIILNAWVCGTFANPIDRLGNRMIWLIPMYSLIMLTWMKRKKQPDSY
jgi:hypothetical protein